MEKKPGEKIIQEAGPLGRPLHALEILGAGLQALKLQACKLSSLTRDLGYYKIIKKEK
tara:strand:+ start:678 stop:851 length:174 start_codon:yes stop_codon:yes gene_type:complete